MTRKKVKLVWIANDAARKASLKKRRAGLIKKVGELTTLCGVRAFIVIYSPDEVEPSIWPSRSSIQQLLTRFHGLPEMERSKKMMNQETYMKERVAKIQDLMKRHQRRNKEAEATLLLHQVNGGKELGEFHVTELQGLLWMLDEISKEANKKIEYFQQDPVPTHEVGTPQRSRGEDMTRSTCGGPSVGLGSNVRGFPEPLVWDQWFIDMLNNENMGAGTSMGVPHQTYMGGSTIDDMVLPRHHSFLGGSDIGMLAHGNFKAPSTDIHGLQPHMMGFMGPYGGVPADMVLHHPFGNIGGNANINDNGFGTDINMGLGLQQFHLNYGSNSNNAAGNEMAGLPFGLFGSSSNSNNGTETENLLHFDFSKTWPSP
ncbi:hypothetical protein SLEP1_g38633 [Rubroshorea leprosula]|uniref:MADS-box domain-containing protein n=1 Tax=Rubroshorea leprosula TaxID=152421 RepID=A0AAV5KY07_9ROSI|nr:hypothetical protein SLEP1_g38633 [Rubroshorea leprosula]